MTEAEELELLELEELEAQAKAAPAKSSGNADDGFLSNAADAGLKTLEIAGRTLDYPGGLTRTAWQALQDAPRGINKALESVDMELPEWVAPRGAEPVGKYPEDIYRALQGRAPTTQEYAKRQGAVDSTGGMIGGIAVDMLKDPLTYVGLGPLKAALSKAGYGAGKNLYKGGLSTIDQEAIKYGKEPVSDVLMDKGATSWTTGGIQKQMDEIADGYLKERDSILKAADKAGAEVDMNRAMAPVLEKIRKIRADNDPNLLKLADTMEADVMQYIQRGAKEPEMVLRELPVKSRFTPGHSEIKGFEIVDGDLVRLPVQAKQVAGGEAVGRLPIGKSTPDRFLQDTFTTVPDQLGPNLKKYPTQFDAKVGTQAIPDQYKLNDELMYTGTQRVPIRGKTVEESFGLVKPEVMLDYTPRQSGPTARQASAWKSSEYNKIGDEAYNQMRATPVGKDLSKTKARGLNETTTKAVEDSVGLGDELSYLNERLGRLLTTKEKAATEAAKEARKPIFSQTKAAVTAASPTAGMAMKAMELANMAGPRTKIGMGLMNRSDDLMRSYNVNGMSVNPMGPMEHLLYSPWVTIQRQTEEDK